MKKIHLVIIACLSFSVSLQNCVGDSMALVSISISPGNPTLSTGMTLQMSALGFNNDGTYQDLTATATWASSNNGIASIDATGIITAVAGGSTIITATSGSVSASMPVTVNSSGVQATLAYIAISPNNPALATGSTLQVQAISTYTDNSIQDLTTTVTWNSDNTAVATIDTTGLVTGISGGTAIITATSGTVSASMPVTINNYSSQVSLTYITLTPSNPTLASGMTLQMQAIGTYGDNSVQDLTSTAIWNSDNTAVATIDTTGLVAGISGGSAIITATSGTVSASMPVTVSNPGTPVSLAYISITPANPALSPGSTSQLQAIGTYSDNSAQDLTSAVAWNSNDGNIATISTTGLLTGVNAGNVSISATSGTTTVNTIVTVTSGSFILPPVPTGLTAQAMGGKVFLQWGSISGAASYNVYWQNSFGVTKTGSNLISNVNSGYLHTNISNGIEYFYAITAIVGGVESDLSGEVSAIPMIGTEDTTNWNKIFNGNGNEDVTTGIKIDKGDNIYVIGYGNGFISASSLKDWWIKKFSSTGVEDTVNWNKSFDSGGGDEALAIAIDNNDNIYIVGYGTNLVTASSFNDWWIKKFSPSGIEDTANWNKMFDTGGFDKATSVVIDSLDNVYIAGIGDNRANGTSGQDWWIKKFSSAGVEDTVNWNKGFTSTSTLYDYPSTMAIDSLNNIYVGGTSINLVTGTSGYDWWIKKFSSAGVEDTVNWNKGITFSDPYAEKLTSITIGNSDNVFITGSCYPAMGTISTNWCIKKFNSNGIEDTVNWDKVYDLSIYEQGTGITIDSQGNIYASGYGSNLISGFSNFDWWIKKFYP